MITLITGVPGSSKTLNAFNEILTDDALKNRPVFYHNIKEVKAENWTELSDDEARSWYQLPEGSVVFLDECQRIFRPMKYGDKVPAHIEELETHRHLGIDLIIITQHPKLIDTKVRRLVGRHLHFKRQFGMESATRIEFQKCADDPDDYFAQKEAIKKRVKFPKHLYGMYKSSEVHTHKRRIPMKLYGIGVAFLLAIGLIYTAVAGFGDNPAQASPIEEMKASTLPSRLNGEPVSKADTIKSWADQRTPRVADIPWSAPVYDGLTEVKSFPRPQCMIREATDTCTCYTQQATPLEVSQAQCERIVAGGYFDPTKPDKARSSEAASGEGVAPADAGATSPHQRILNALKLRAEIADI